MNIVNLIRLLLLAAVGCFSILAFAQDEYGDIRGAVPDVLDDLANRTHTVIGVYAVINTHADENAVYTDVGILRKDTLKQALDKIVSQAPGYVWTQDADGVVHMAWGKKPSVLDLAIPSFHITGETRSSTLSSLHDIPLMRMWMFSHECQYMSTNNIVQLIGGPPPADVNDQTTYDVNESNLSMAHLLDAVAAQEHAYFWKVFENRTVTWKSEITDTETGKRISGHGGSCFMTLSFRQVVSYGGKSRTREHPEAPL